jgi:hypothetical protein
MLGHRSMDMTLRYAKIANRTVADEYFAVTDKVEALYGKPQQLPPDAIGPKMARLRREHHRLLGNGYCTRPAELDCAFESICENCTFFQTSIEFRPPCKPNTTMPKPKANTTEPTCSSDSSTTSTNTKHHDPLDADHPHNADERASSPGRS